MPWFYFFLRSKIRSFLHRCKTFPLRREARGQKAWQKISRQGMASWEQFKLFCQIHQIISLVTLGAPDSLMSGHVLNLLQQHQMKLYHLEVHHHPHVLWLQQGVDLLAYYFVMQLYFKVSILFLVRFLIIRLSGSFLIRSPSATLL